MVPLDSSQSYCVACFITKETIPDIYSIYSGAFSVVFGVRLVVFFWGGSHIFFTFRSAFVTNKYIVLLRLK